MAKTAKKITKVKKLSNPFSTSGGGSGFETRVQASFAVLMLSNGFSPCLAPWPIQNIKLQAKHIGFETDDLVVYVKDKNTNAVAKLLAQVKHSISFTLKDKKFSEVIQSAWKDFTNPAVFCSETDRIALITGPMSASDIENARTILEWARDSTSAIDFIAKVEKTNFSSNAKRQKLKALRKNLDKAKKSPVTDEELWSFSKIFHFLGYDLDLRAGVTFSLLHSLIGQYSFDNAHNIWARIAEEVQFVNQAAGVLENKTMPADIQAAFKLREPPRQIPEDLTAQIEPKQTQNVSSLPYSPDVVAAVLLGSWNEAARGDQLVASQLSQQPYADWIAKLRRILFG